MRSGVGGFPEDQLEWRPEAAGEGVEEEAAAAAKSGGCSAARRRLSSSKKPPEMSFGFLPSVQVEAGDVTVSLPGRVMLVSKYWWTAAGVSVPAEGPAGAPGKFNSRLPEDDPNLWPHDQTDPGKRKWLRTVQFKKKKVNLAERN